MSPGPPFTPLVAPTPRLGGPLAAPWGEMLAGFPLEAESRAGPKSSAGVGFDRRGGGEGGGVGLGEHAAAARVCVCVFVVKRINHLLSGRGDL